MGAARLGTGRAWSAREQGPEMESSQDFIDYYDVLQVDPNCDARILEIAYHYFAKMYHPDHAETANPDKFNSVVEAYRVLRNPEKREEYNRVYALNREQPPRTVHIERELEIDESTAIDDEAIREKILLHLYKRRRENPSDPGVIGWLLQEALECSDEQFDFHMWYLKAKGLIAITEDSGLAITIEGVDHIIATARAKPEPQLLIDKVVDEVIVAEGAAAEEE